MTLVKTVEIAKALGTTRGNNTEWEKENSRKYAWSVLKSALSLAGYRLSHKITQRLGGLFCCLLLAEIKERKRLLDGLLCYSYIYWEKSAGRYFLFFFPFFTFWFLERGLEHCLKRKAACFINTIREYNDGVSVWFHWLLVCLVLVFKYLIVLLHLWDFKVQVNECGNNLCVLMHVLVDPDSGSRNLSSGNNVSLHCYQVHFSLFALF